MLPTFVISLSDSTDRRNLIWRRLSDLRISFEWVDAVDGRHGLAAEFEPMIDRVNGVDLGGLPLLDVEFACALSHIKALQMVIDRDLDYALVMEDDAIPDPKLPEYLAGRHFVDAELTSLNYGRAWVRRGAKETIDGHRSYVVVPDVYLTSTAGYIVSREAARHIVESALPVASNADWPACTEWFKMQRRWRVVYPRLVHHAPRETDPTTSIIYQHGKAAKKRQVRRILGVRMPRSGVTVRTWGRGVFGPLMGLKRIKRAGPADVPDLDDNGH